MMVSRVALLFEDSEPCAPWHQRCRVVSSLPHRPRGSSSGHNFPKPSAEKEPFLCVISDRLPASEFIGANTSQIVFSKERFRRYHDESMTFQIRIKRNSTSWHFVGSNVLFGVRISLPEVCDVVHDPVHMLYDRMSGFRSQELSGYYQAIKR